MELIFSSYTARFSASTIFILVLSQLSPSTARPALNSISDPYTDPNSNPNFNQYPDTSPDLYPDLYSNQDTYYSPSPSSSSSSSPPKYAEVNHLQGSHSPPHVTLRIDPPINTVNINNVNNNPGTGTDTIIVPLFQETEYQPDEPLYQSARAGSKPFPNPHDIERAVIVDGPDGSDEIVCMFDGTTSMTDSNGYGYRYGEPFVMGETASFAGARAVRCIAFYYKGERGRGGTVNGS